MGLFLSREPFDAPRNFAQAKVLCENGLYRPFFHAMLERGVALAPAPTRSSSSRWRTATTTSPVQSNGRARPRRLSRRHEYARFAARVGRFDRASCPTAPTTPVTLLATTTVSPSWPAIRPWRGRRRGANCPTSSSCASRAAWRSSRRPPACATAGATRAPDYERLREVVVAHGGRSRASAAAPGLRGRRGRRLARLARRRHRGVVLDRLLGREASSPGASGVEPDPERPADGFSQFGARTRRGPLSAEPRRPWTRRRPRRRRRRTPVWGEISTVFDTCLGVSYARTASTAGPDSSRTIRSTSKSSPRRPTAASRSSRRRSTTSRRRWCIATPPRCHEKPFGSCFVDVQRALIAPTYA
jgi:hypothetical protein